MVSVVIPLYNKESAIRQTIKSVLSQTYTDFELIVVDNASTDNSVREVQSIYDERIRLLSQPKKGVCAARNIGIIEARGEYVALLDADDIWDKDCLKELVQLTIDFPDAGLLGVNYADIRRGKIFPYKQGVVDDFRGFVDDYFGTSHGDMYCSSSVILCREMAMRVGLFDERMAYAEDLDFWYRMILSTKVVFYNKTLAFYNKDADNRVEKNIDTHFDIYKRMDFYIDKYVPYFEKNVTFAKFICVRVAWNILRGNYYFGNKYDREATDKIVQYLAFEHMPYKYRLIFRTPRFIGRVVYELTKLVKK